MGRKGYCGAPADARAETRSDPGGADLGNPFTRRWLAIVLTLAACMASSALDKAWSQVEARYPDRLIKIIVPLPAGGTMDALSRVVGEKLSASMGQPVIVENKPGASGGIGASAVAQAKPDGYTLLFAIASTIQSISLQKAPPFKLSELEPITQLAELPTGFAVRRDLGANTLADFVALAKAKPKTLSFGSFGNGSTGHIVGEGLAAAAKVEMVHVPYKGEAPAITDLLGGHISSAFASVGSLGQQSGTVKLLAITGSHRLKQFPDVPTFQELGFPTLRTDRLGWRLCAGWNAEGHCGQAGNRNRRASCGRPKCRQESWTRASNRWEIRRHPSRRL